VCAPSARNPARSALSRSPPQESFTLDDLDPVSSDIDTMRRKPDRVARAVLQPDQPKEPAGGEWFGPYCKHGDRHFARFVRYE
jgi:hypothetical protein